MNLFAWWRSIVKEIVKRIRKFAVLASSSDMWSLAYFFLAHCKMGHLSYGNRSCSKCWNRAASLQFLISKEVFSQSFLSEMQHFFSNCISKLRIRRGIHYVFDSDRVSHIPSEACGGSQYSASMMYMLVHFSLDLNNSNGTFFASLVLLPAHYLMSCPAE